jgi:hypothetical protein
MTNHWIDIKNSDCILIMGSNAAENHPISFKYVTEAMEKGATLISVDPRFTRTSSKADIYTALRSGTDIAFLGGMIKYILENKLYSKEYVSLYTNAPFIVGRKYGFKDGLFSGYEKNPKGPSMGKYDKSQWAFEMDKNGVPKMDRSLKHKRCVFQLLKKHYSRYDFQTVSKITGTSEADLKRVYDAYSATGVNGHGRYHHVRHGLDPAHHRHPEHPYHGHHPAAAGQHGRGRRRRQRPARRIQCPGVHGPLPAVAHLAGLPENGTGIQHYPGGIQSKMDTSQQGSPVRQLVAELPQIQRIHAQILFRRKGQCGQRVRLSMAAQGR